MIVRRGLAVILSLFFFLCIFILSLKAQTHGLDIAYAEAEESYRENDYNTAATVYEDIIAGGFINGEILYNLGNCYYKQGEYGHTILNYERARRYLGNDPDLNVNLKLANMRIFDRIEPMPRFFLITLFNKAASMLSVKEWSILFILTEWLVAVCLIALHSVRRIRWRKILLTGFLFFGAVFVLSGAFFVQQKIYQDNLTEAIVMIKDVEIRSAPEAEATKLFALHEGVKMEILREVAQWSEIRLADGKRGWILKEAYEVI
ncbi:hypothetical protein CEE37_01280 [candidate division LCP-89 bacterium B3_LCP]|uniref:SH3b domain-containing protein n=1 Tax=candidate division LCP-89 bacterium B3_LCP TaxID=2012998 RepID=A0A532V5C3_UNCL8|nr:MAG: hypothetical protein CEE37_01280 [candidate division LCP-89 bacterium B3_LCP]